ncbi:MAG: hypothetical protein Q9165_005540 [Trypethelium subeluteriae]
MPRSSRQQMITVNVQSASTMSAAKPLPHSFEKKVEDVKVSKSLVRIKLPDKTGIDSDINSVIMDYLINEGYPSAARKFAKEANIEATGDIESISERVEIRNAILAGDIQAALEKINDFNPQVLDTDPALHFSLLRLQLIELIRTCMSPTSSTSTTSTSTSTSTPDITPVLNFASTQLAPRAPTSPTFLNDLEQTMALLIFPPDALSPTLSPLLDTQLRRDVATAVNQAMLVSLGQRREARIKSLVRVRAWAEAKAREGGGGGAAVKLPERLSLGLDGEGKEGGVGAGAGGREGNGESREGEPDAMVT